MTNAMYVVKFCCKNYYWIRNIFNINAGMSIIDENVGRYNYQD